MEFGKSYFNVISVYPATDGIYDWWGASKSFMDMTGFERWSDLRINKLLFESKEVYVRKDISVDELTVIQSELGSNLSDMYDKLIADAEAKFSKTFKTMNDQAVLLADKKAAKDKVNEEFTKYLNDNYELIKFDE